MGVLTDQVFGDTKISEEALGPRERAMSVLSPFPLESIIGPAYNDPASQQFGLDIFDEMYALDPQVRACHHTKVMARLMTGWEFIPSGNKKVDEFITYTTTNMAGSMHDFLRDLMEALKYGFAVVEIVWDRYTDGPYRGYLGIKALKAKPAKSFRFDTDRRGNLKKRGIRQHINGLPQDIKLPRDKFIVYTYQKEPGGFYGRSDFQPVYRHYFLKQALERWWSAYLEKFAGPTAIGKFPQGATESEKKEVLAFLRKLQNNSAAIFPEKWEIELLEAKEGGSENFIRALTYHNKMVARGILVPDLIQDQGDRSGSYSLGQVHASNFLWVLKGIGRELETVVDEQLVRRVIDVNFSVDKYPTFQFMEFEPENVQSVASMFLSLVNGGIIAPDDPVIRRRLNLPAEGAEKLEKRPNVTVGGLPGAPVRTSGVQPPNGRVPSAGSSPTAGDKSPMLNSEDFAVKYIVTSRVDGHRHFAITDEWGDGVTTWGESRDGIPHIHQVRKWAVIESEEHEHDLPHENAPKDALSKRRIRAEAASDPYSPPGGGGGPKDEAHGGHNPPGSGLSELPELMFTDPEALLGEHFRIAGEQYLAKVARAGGPSEGMRTLDVPKIKQLGRFKEDLAGMMTEQMCQGALGALLAEEGDEEIPLPDGESPEGALWEVYGDLYPLLSEKVKEAEEIAYSMAGSMDGLVREASHRGKVAMAAGKSPDEVMSAVDTVLRAEEPRLTATEELSECLHTWRITGRTVMSDWLDRNQRNSTG